MAMHEEIQENFYLDTRSLKTILFYVRLTNHPDDEEIKVLKDSMLYVLQTQFEMGKRIVGTIYIESWVYNLISSDINSLMEKYSPNTIKVWPIIENISPQMPGDTTKLLQQRIDYVYTFGGDGTLLALL